MSTRDSSVQSESVKPSMSAQFREHWLAWSIVAVYSAAGALAVSFMLGMFLFDRSWFNAAVSALLQGGM